MLSIKAASLTLLCIWMTLLTVVMHVSRTERPPGTPPYKPASAVILAELGKLLCSLLLAYRECKRALSQEKERAQSPLYSNNISGEHASLLYDNANGSGKGNASASTPTARTDDGNGNGRMNRSNSRNGGGGGGGEGSGTSVDMEIKSEKSSRKPLLLPAARISSSPASSPMSKRNSNSNSNTISGSRSRSSQGHSTPSNGVDDKNDHKEADDDDDEGMAAGENDKFISSGGDDGGDDVDVDVGKEHYYNEYTNPTTPSRLSNQQRTSYYPSNPSRSQHHHHNDHNDKNGNDKISSEQVLQRMKEDTFGPDWLKLAIPAFLFTGQSNLSYYASSNLSVPVFQITYQLKIPATALCSVLMLNRALSRMQWFSIVLLSLGVGIVQLASSSADKIYHPHTTGSSDGTPSEQDYIFGPGINNSTGGDPLLDGRSTHKLRLLRPAAEGVEMNQMLGLIAVVLACLSSGFSGVFFEKQLKKPSMPASVPTSSSLSPSSLSSNPPSPDLATSSTPGNFNSANNDNHYSPIHSSSSYPPPPPRKTGLWVRNIQLSMFSLFVGATIYALMSPSDIPDFLIGFTPLVWFVVFVQIVGGLLAAIVIQYADNIAKSFSASCSIILSFAVSIAFFDFRLSAGVVVGSAAVIFATWLFNFSQPKPSSANNNNNNNTMSFLPTSQSSSPVSKTAYHHVPTSPSPFRAGSGGASHSNTTHHHQDDSRRPSVFPWVGTS